MNKSHLPEFLRCRIRIWDLIAAGGAVIAAATVFAFGGGQWWVLDLFTHFRVQYFLGLTVVSLVLLIRRRFKTALGFVLFAVINLGTIAPLYLGGTFPSTGGLTSHRAMLMNVNSQAGDPVKVGEAIKTMDPDVLVLEEVSERWLSELRPVLQSFPHSEVVPRDDNFGIALYIKWPLVQSDIRYLGEAEVPSIMAALETPEGRLTLIATHPVPPVGAAYSRLRNGQFERLAELVKQTSPPVLVLGDLNATPWCPHFQRLLVRSGLRDSSQGRGILPTWPTYVPPLQIPLDHCLHTEGIGIVRKVRGPNVGSDHYPLAVDFVRTPPATRVAN